MKKQALVISFVFASLQLLSQNTFPTGSGTNVGIGTTSPTARLEVTSGTSGASGIKLTNMTSASSTSTANNKALSVDASGNIILVPSVGANSNIYNTSGTLTSNRNVTLSGRNLTFTPTTASSEIFINGSSGFMGLGTLTPASRLEVNGTTKSKNLFVDHGATISTSFANVLAYYNNSNIFGAGYEMNHPYVSGAKRRMLNFYDSQENTTYNSGYNRFNLNIVDRNNKERFMVWGSSNGASMNDTNLVLNDKNGTEFFKIMDGGAGDINVQMLQSNSRLVIGTWATDTPSLGHKLFVKAGSARIEGDILTDSNIGIGTSNFTDASDTYRLSVNGAVRANRVKVYTTWADFVFEKDYALPTLEEVEKHIAKKGHLKDIPSAAEVESKGIELGEMNKLLLQKIEELTLYVIQLNKELEAIKTGMKN